MVPNTNRRPSTPHRPSEHQLPPRTAHAPRKELRACRGVLIRDRPPCWHAACARGVRGVLVVYEAPHPPSTMKTVTRSFYAVPILWFGGRRPARTRVALPAHPGGPHVATRVFQSVQRAARGAVRGSPTPFLSKMRPLNNTPQIVDVNSRGALKTRGTYDSHTPVTRIRTVGRMRGHARSVVESLGTRRCVCTSGLI